MTTQTQQCSINPCSVCGGCTETPVMISEEEEHPDISWCEGIGAVDNDWTGAQTSVLLIGATTSHANQLTWR